MVVVDKRDADASFFALDADAFRNVLKFSVALIAQEVHAVLETDAKVRVTVVIEIAGGASETRATESETAALRHVLKPALSDVVQQPARTVGGRAHQEKVRLAVAVIIEKTRARARAGKICGGGGREKWL